MKDIKIKNKLTPKLIAGSIVVLILDLLIFTGGVNAFDLKLSVDKAISSVGDTIKFIASIAIKSDERAEINYLNMVISGPTSKICKFDVSGGIISGCDGIKNITLLNAPDYGYGYGYGYSNGNLSYEIILDTTHYQRGSYNTELQADINGEIFRQKGESFTIKEKWVDDEDDDHKYSEEKEEKIIVKINLLNIKENEEYSLDYNFHQYILKIDKIDSLENSVLLTLESEKIELNLGEAKEVDLDSDGIYDAKISLLFVGDKIASLLINSENKQLDIKPIKQITEIPSINQNTDNIKQTRVSVSNNPLFDKWAIIILILLNLIVLEAILVVKSRRYSERHK